MLRIEKIGNHIEGIRKKYLITTEGKVYITRASKTVGRRDNGVQKSKGITNLVNEKIKEANDLGLEFVNFKVEGYDQNLIATKDGVFAKELLMQIDNSKGKGYYTASFQKEGDADNKKRFPYPIHRIIKECFFNLGPNMCLHHIDLDKLNNKIENLLPMTMSEHIGYHKNLTYNNLEKANTILEYAVQRLSLSRE